MWKLSSKFCCIFWGPELLLCSTLLHIGCTIDNGVLDNLRIVTNDGLTNFCSNVNSIYIYTLLKELKRVGGVLSHNQHRPLSRKLLSLIIKSKWRVPSPPRSVQWCITANSKAGLPPGKLTGFSLAAAQPTELNWATTSLTKSALPLFPLFVQSRSITKKASCPTFFNIFAWN